MPVDLTPDDLRHLATTCLCADVLYDERQRLERLAILFRHLAEQPLGGATLWSVPLSRRDASLLLIVCKARLASATIAHADAVTFQTHTTAGKSALVALRRVHIERLEAQIAALEIHLKKPLARLASRLP